MMPYQIINPNYFAQYPQLFQPQNQNPYMQRMENLQQFQQAINPAPVQPTFTAMGKMVESIDMVKATDIPMDGRTYYFPNADGSMVFAKRWLPNGTTEVTSYKPYLEENEPKPSNVSSDDIKTQFGAFGEVLGAIQNDIRMLFDKVDKISKPAKQKGGADNE